ncbi:MAG: SLBB domain-containing protein [Planctomycetota bacterium]
MPSSNRLRALTGLVAALACSACQSSQDPPSGRPGEELASAAYWLQDESFAQARAVALSGIPSPTPELDALAELARVTTPELQLQQLLSPAAAAVPPARLRPGDRLEIEVYGRPEFSGERRVGPDGKLPMFLLGSVEVADQTESEAAQTLSLGLRAHVKQAQVSLWIKERTKVSAALTGLVRKPGSVPLPDERRLSLVGLLALGGGLAEDADGGRLALLRRGEGDTQRCYHFTHDELVAAHLRGQEAWVEPEDELVVPRLAQAYVYGAVGKEGAHTLRRGTTVASALLLAGGLAKHANAQEIRVLSQERSRPAKLEAELRPEEVVFVPQRQRVYVVGAGVEKPGPIDLPGSGLTVMQAIAEAGWFTKHAKLGDVEILRYRGNRQVRIEVPVQELLDGERRESEFSLQPGDLVRVPESIW